MKFTQKVDQPTPTHTRAPAFDRAVWWQVFLNVAYVLVAGPRGLCYLLLLAIGLILDLLHLAIRLLLAGILALLYMVARATLWLVWFVWAGAVKILVWVTQTLGWLSISIGRGIARIASSMFVATIHPRRAWRGTVGSMRRDQDRVRAPRPASTASESADTKPVRRRGARFFDSDAVRLTRFRRQVMPNHWIVVPVIWWRLALWEHRHTMRWLNIELPPLGLTGYTTADRTTVPGALWAQLPPASLGYLLAKLPLGALALALAGLAGMPALVLVDLAIHTAISLVSIVSTSAATAVVLVAIYALHLLAHASRHYAHRAFSPSDAMRRLQEAEAQAAQDRVKAERAEQSRRDLIINMSHELRTPTASILGHIESVLLALDAPDTDMLPETLRTYLGIVQREAERLSALVDDLLAVARAERSELQLVITPVDAAAVIHEVYEALAPLARRERQVMLIQEVEPDLPPLLADRQRLSQVLLNLVRNAITYTPAGGIVSIALHRADEDALLLTVADTGSGIAPADLQRVFERFYRADASRTRASGGFGLGLAIARDLVAAMGGTITVESIVGEGSCFYVRLPIATDDQEPMTNAEQ
jgi:signal transduction histidine kinase